MRLLNKDYLGKIKTKKKIIIFLIVLTCISCFSLFMQKYIIIGHDFMFHFSRLEGVVSNIKYNNLFNGLYYEQLNGYGYASPLFYADIFLYIPAFLVVIGFGKYFAYKVFIFVICFLSILFMYLASKSISGNKKTALLVSILYAASSYRLTDVFERCALGEILTFVFLPLVFWGIYEIIYRDKNKYYLLVIGMSGLILSHLITAVLTFLVLFIICLINVKNLFNNKDRIVNLLYSVLFTLLITSYFLFPMIEQMLSQKYSVNYMMDNYPIYDYSSRIYRLLLAVPGIVYNKLFIGAWLPAGMGIAFIIIMVLTIKLVFKDKINSNNNYGKVTLIIGIMGLIFSTNLFPWHSNIIKELFSFMQFPWRILSISTVLILISFSIYYSRSKYLKNNIITNVVIMLAIPVIFIYNIYNLSSIYLQDTLGSDFETIGFGEYLPASDIVSGWSVDEADYYYDIDNKATSKANIELETKRKNKYLYVYYDNNTDNNSIVLPLLYYKGYDIKINAKDVKYYKSKKGLIKVKIHNKKGKIRAYYKGTSIAYYTKMISLISILFFSGLIIYKDKFNKNKV